MKGSIIIAVLESYEIVRRQLLWYSCWLSQQFPDWWLYLVDDGSNPPIISQLKLLPDMCFRHTRILRINIHDQPWTQPAARNYGAKLVNSEYLFFTDIDHIITPEAMKSADEFTGDKLRFPRFVGALDENGALLIRPDDIVEKFGAIPKDMFNRTEHANTFVIRKSIHETLGGYDERFCGKYGGDDTDYNSRYGELHYAGKVQRSEMGDTPIYVFPDPKTDRQHLFHNLRRKGFTQWN